MDSNVLQTREKLGLWLLALGSLTVYLSYAWQPLDRLVGLFSGDDMFYYLQIARNIARGAGVTFDGTTPTNGFHPVYMVFVTGIFALFPGHSPEFYAQASLTLLSVASVATGVFLFFLVRRLNGPRAAALVAVIWLMNPYIMGTVHIGVEVALAALMYAVSMTMYLRWTEAWTQRMPRQLETFAMGALLGLTCLCRTDSMFFALCLGLAMLYCLYRSAFARRWLLHFVTFVGGGCVVILPWFAWNFVRMGTIVQDSARALTSLKHGLYLQTHGWTGIFTVKIPSTIEYWFLNLSNILCLPGPWIAMLFFLLLAWVALRPRHSHGSEHANLSISKRALYLALLGTLVMHLFFYAGYFWFMQKWYFLSPTVCIVVLFGAVYEQIEGWISKRKVPQQIEGWISKRKVPQRILWGSMFVLVMGLFVWRGSPAVRNGFYPWQTLYFNIAKNMKKQLPTGTRMGTFNTGIYGYVMDRGVVNLDGVVNGQVLQALKKKKLLAYLHRMKITHVVDHINAIQHFAAWAEPSFQKSFQLRGRVRANTTGGDILILRLIPPVTRLRPYPRTTSTSKRTHR